MNYETIHAIKVGLRIFDSLDYAISIGQMLVWIAAWYILYQLTKLRFILVVLSGDILYIILELFKKRYYVVGGPEQPYSPDHGLFLLVATKLVGFVALMLTTAGACIALRFLQKKWSEREDSQPSFPGDSLKAPPEK